MRIHVSFSILAATFALVGCPPAVTPLPDASDTGAPPTPPIVDAGPAPLTDAVPDVAPTPPTPPAPPVTADCTLACAALKAAGCGLGDAGDCAAFMTRDIGSGKVANLTTGKPLTCADVKTVKTRADAQKQGFVCGQ